MHLNISVYISQNLCVHEKDKKDIVIVIVILHGHSERKSYVYVYENLLQLICVGNDTVIYYTIYSLQSIRTFE